MVSKNDGNPSAKPKKVAKTIVEAPQPMRSIGEKKTVARKFANVDDQEICKKLMDLEKNPVCPSGGGGENEEKRKGFADYAKSHKKNRGSVRECEGGGGGVPRQCEEKKGENGRRCNS